VRPLFCLVLLAAAPDRITVMEETVRVERSSWRPVLLPVRRAPAMMECSFAVAAPGKARLALMRMDDFRRLEAGKAHAVIASTGFERGSRFRVRLSAPGDYALVVDNRLEGRGPADVHLRVQVEFAARPRARMLSRERRAAVVAVSLAGFFGIVWWSSRKLLRAMRAQRTPGPPPPSA